MGESTGPWRDDPRIGADLTVTELSPEAPGSILVWRRLWERCVDATPFDHPDWLCPWLAHLGEGMRPRIVAVRRGSELVGLAPLGEEPASEGEEWQLVLLGGEQTDYHGVLAAPGQRRAVAFALLRWLSSRSAWTRCVLSQVEATSPVVEQLDAPDALRLRRREQDVCPRLSIPEAARTPADVVPRGFWKRICQSRRRAARAGRCEIRHLTREGDVLPALDRLFSLHGKEWASRGEEGVLAEPAVRRFHQEAAPRLARADLLRFVEVWMDGAPIASLLALEARGRVLHYLSGFDPAAGRLSPGRLAIAALVQAAVEAGAREVDFLRGVEAYKYDWGATDRTTWAVVVERREEEP